MKPLSVIEIEHDYYADLELQPPASRVEVENAWVFLSRTKRPDKHSEPEAHDKFRVINEAWQFLQDPDRKLEYDRLRDRSNDRPTADTDESAWDPWTEPAVNESTSSWDPPPRIPPPFVKPVTDGLGAGRYDENGWPKPTPNWESNNGVDPAANREERWEEFRKGVKKAEEEQVEMDKARLKEYEQELKDSRATGEDTTEVEARLAKLKEKIESGQVYWEGRLGW